MQESRADPPPLRLRTRRSSTRRHLTLLVFLSCAACRRAPPEPARAEAEGRAALASAHADEHAGARTPEPASASSARAGPRTGSAATGDASFRYPGAPRVVAIGDIHGDLRAARRALRLAGAVNDEDDWIGEKLVVVQTGDEIDRGDDDRAVIDLFSRLSEKARAAGGRVHALNGNHEVMNVQGDFRYVTPGGFAAFASEVSRAPAGVPLDRFPPEARGRAAAFAPGGAYARKLAERDSVAMVGDTVFVHGGVTAEHVRRGLGRLNAEVRSWMRNGGAPPPLAEDPDGPLWTRRYSDDQSGIDCDGLGAALSALGATRMVIGHTPHADGISPACGERVWRIDSGLSAFYGGPMEVLDIQGGRVTVLKAPDEDK